MTSFDLAQSAEEISEPTEAARCDVHLVLSKAYPGADKLMGRLEDIAKTIDVQKLLFKGGSEDK